MKNPLFLILGLLVTLSVTAQNYQIGFYGSGETNYVDSVYVKNLTQGTSLSLRGIDMLHLVETLGIGSQSEIVSDVQIYPNPMQETSRMEFQCSKPDDALIEVFNLNGNCIASYSGEINAGKIVFELSGIPAGAYTANLSTSTDQKSYSFISVNNTAGAPFIKIRETIASSAKSSSKDTKSVIQMQYNDGDNLLFKGISGNYARVLTIVPTHSQTLFFEFTECTDYDGNNYAVASIGDQTWMAENLNSKHYPDGTPVPLVEDPQQWAWLDDNNTDDAMCYYDNIEENGDVYGAFYTWSAAMGDNAVSSNTNPSEVQGICPDGWHLPSNAEWMELINFLGGEDIAGGKLKETGNDHWVNENAGAVNSHGFTALPGGFRRGSASYIGLGTSAFFWTSTESGSEDAGLKKLGFGIENIPHYNLNKSLGHSVRCVMD